MKRKAIQKILIALVAATLGSFACLQTQAVPYASGVTKSGNTVSFILNQTAASVTVLRNGGNAVTLGTSPGTLSFDMTGYTSYQIIVTGNTAKVWTQYVPDQANVTGFEYPFGVAVNKVPSSTNFGKVFVSNARALPTGLGRACSDGIYILHADGTAAGFTTGGVSWTGNSAPFKSTVGPDGHLYVSDLSNDLAYEFNDDMSVATLLIDGSNKTGSQWVGGILVEGTQAGGDRKLYLVDSNGADAARKGIIGYDLTSNPTATPGDTGTQIVGPTYYGASYYPSDVARDSNGDWYVDSYRAILNQMPPITKFNGAGTLPLGAANVIWEADKATYYYAYCMDINEKAGLAANGNALNGIVTFFNRTNGAFIESFDAGGAIRELAFDAAGNLMTVDNSAEWLRFWSPGGFTVATTSFNGSEAGFTIENLVLPIDVTVTASTPTANEQGPVNGVFTLTRTGDTSGALTVNYTVSGSATAGSDYTTLPGSVTFLAGATSTNITVSVNNDPNAELTETVILTVTSGGGYAIGTPANATVSILDNESPEISFSTVATNKLLESYAPSKVTLQLTRRGLLTPALTVNLTYTGTATQGTDFNAPLSVALAGNAATTNITLTPINDQAYEGNELAIANVASNGVAYTIDTTNTAAASVIDDETPFGGAWFSDSFNVDSSALWQTNLADPSDGFVDFAWDYGTLAGIPPAPATTDGSTKGLRFRCGNVILQPSAVSASPLGGNFTGNYRLKFDMWFNYNGPMPDGGAGSTQHFDAGVGTAGDQVIWYNNPSSDGVWFTCSGDGADGGTFGDYSAFIGDINQNDDTGFYAAGTGPVNGGLRDNANVFYTSLWGGQAAPAAQLLLYPGQTGVANLGNAGMAWHSVVITKVDDTVKWQMDGITICTVTNDPSGLSTNIFVGIQDRFAGNGISDEPAMSFGLVDNLRVETYLSAPILITKIEIVGGNVEVTFSGPPEKAANAFKLFGSATVNGTYADEVASMSNVSTGVFKATKALATTPKFFKVVLPP